MTRPVVLEHDRDDRRPAYTLCGQERDHDPVPEDAMVLPCVRCFNEALRREQAGQAATQ